MTFLGLLFVLRRAKLSHSRAMLRGCLSGAVAGSINATAIIGEYKSSCTETVANPHIVTEATEHRAAASLSRNGNLLEMVSTLVHACPSSRPYANRRLFACGDLGSNGPQAGCRRTSSMSGRRAWLFAAHLYLTISIKRPPTAKGISHTATRSYCDMEDSRCM
jgi:hypothetical protein